MSKRGFFLLGFAILGVLGLFGKALERDAPLVQIDRIVTEEAPVADPIPEPEPDPACQGLEGLLPDVGEVVEVSLMREGKLMRTVWASVVAKALDVDRDKDHDEICVSVFLSYPTSGLEVRSSAPLALGSRDAMVWSLIHSGAGIDANYARIKRDISPAPEVDPDQP